MIEFLKKQIGLPEGPLVATRAPFIAFLIGLAASLGAGIGMGLLNRTAICLKRSQNLSQIDFFSLQSSKSDSLLVKD